MVKTFFYYHSKALKRAQDQLNIAATFLSHNGAVFSYAVMDDIHNQNSFLKDPIRIIRVVVLLIKPR